MCLDVSTGGELHVALAAGVPADRLVLHGNNKSDAELAAALPVGRRPDRGRLLRRDRPHRAPVPLRSRGRPDVAGHRSVAPKVLARITPGVEVHTHEFVRTGQDDSKFGFGLASGAAARPPSTGSPASTPGGWSSSPGSTPTWAARSSPWPRSRRPSPCWPSSSPRSDLPELVVGGGLGVAYVNGEEAPPMAQWAASVRGGVPRRRVSPTRSGSPPSPGGPSWPPPAITLYRVGTIKDVPGHRTYVSRGRRDERQSAPGAVRERL